MRRSPRPGTGPICQSVMPNPAALRRGAEATIAVVFVHGQAPAPALSNPQHVMQRLAQPLRQETQFLRPRLPVAQQRTSVAQ
ncbi:hypothetical protein GCM10010246_66250 [Streptomyces cuspidosporus]|uniref:Uncharacterized protein n=1 Tax=Streptomyces cuspidosporus TaxID=66882 RepID=A0ABP5TYA1_9ACTN